MKVLSLKKNEALSMFCLSATARVKIDRDSERGKEIMGSS